MAIDPSIVLSGRQYEAPDLSKLVQLRNLRLAGDTAQLNFDQATTQAEQQRTLADIYKGATNSDGTINNDTLLSSMAQRGLGAQIPGTVKATREANRADVEAKGADLKFKQQRLQMTGSALASLLQKPDVTHDDVINVFSNLVQQGIATPDEGAAAVRSLPGPNQLRPFLIQKAAETMEAEKQLTTLAPKYDEQDRGGVINQGTLNPVTGQRTAGVDVAKTATPGEKMTDARVKAATSGKSFTPEEADLMGALAERGVNLPAGLRSREQMKSTFASLLARNPGLSSMDIAEKIATGQINLGAERKESQTAAAQAGRIAVAQNEIKQFVPIARAASQALPRGDFVPWNKLSQYTDEQLSSPQLAEFKAYMTTLSNAYDQLAARGGTDADKRAHNRKMFDTAQSPEALEAVFKALETEAAAADVAAHAATQRRTPGHGAPPAATPAGATVSNWGP
jgi:hypothetical protein